VPHFWRILPEVGFFAWIGKNHVGTAALGCPFEAKLGEARLFPSRRIPTPGNPAKNLFLGNSQRTRRVEELWRKQS